MWNLSLTVDLSNVTLVFRSSCWEEFWKKGVLRNSYALTLKLCQNSWKNYLWSLSACIFTKKNEFFHRYFSRILISFQNSRLFNRLLSNCVFMFINFCSCWDIDLCSFFKFLCFFFIEKTLYWIFWRHFVYFCIWSTSVNMVTVNWESLSPPHPPHFDRSLGKEIDLYFCNLIGEFRMLSTNYDGTVFAKCFTL